MRIVLFGLTGYTNDVLPMIRADNRVELCAIFTRRYETPYPYYPIPQIHEVCAELGVPCHTNLRVGSGAGFDLLRGYEPDLILMTGFDQILREPVLTLPRLGAINLHPSLLPDFRGADPIQAVLLEGVARTGVTFHYAVPEIDAGNILVQAAYPVAAGETNGSLRRALAHLAAECVPRVIDLFADGSRPAGTRQEGRPTVATRRFTEGVHLDRSLDPRELHKIVRAVLPYPGASVRHRGVDRIVASATLIEGTPADSAGKPPIDEEHHLIVERKGVRLVLTLS